MEDTAVPVMENVEYTFGYEDVRGFFGRTVKGFMLKLEPSGGNALYLWCTDGGNEVWICGNLSARLYRFALWVGYGLMTLPYGTIAVHSSCIVYRDRAVLFLGESGTGKSTHTRLWREHVEGAFLLNDDSPVLRVEDGRRAGLWKPWSGETPCYRQECYKLEACVRLSQAPYNRITRLSVLQAYGAVHPSCPPEFAYDNGLYDHVTDVSTSCSRLFRSITWRASRPGSRTTCLPDDFQGYDMRKIPNELFFSRVEAEIAGGRPVRFRLKGWSMFPLLRDGRDEVVLYPCTEDELQPMDVYFSDITEDTCCTASSRGRYPAVHPGGRLFCSPGAVYGCRCGREGTFRHPAVRQGTVRKQLALAVVGHAVEQDGDIQESAPKNPALSGRVT